MNDVFHGKIGDKMKNTVILLETKHCLGYGCSCYINNYDFEDPAVSFLRAFCMWGASTNTYGKDDEWKFYELPEETVTFMISDPFAWFCKQNQIELIIDPDRDRLSEVFGK